MNPNQIADYRANTSRYKPINTAMKLCAGCRQRRSAGQFALGDDLCLKCRRRAKP
ncbi:MAG: hypothetical protein ACM3WS_03625 [Bacillota bacterium]